jgi:hypothetical protein
MYFTDVKAAHSGSDKSICACCECCVELCLVTWNLIDWLNFIEIEWKFARNATVESGLEICNPVLTENILAADVTLADTSNTWVDSLSAIDVLDRCFTEEKVDIFTDVKWSHKVWFYRKGSDWKNEQINQIESARTDIEKRRLVSVECWVNMWSKGLKIFL